MSDIIVTDNLVKTTIIIERPYSNDDEMVKAIKDCKEAIALSADPNEEIEGVL